MTKKNIAILLFDDVEVLDFAGPFEVFSVTNELADYSLMDVYSVARENKPVIARNGLSVNPDYSIKDAPTPDILIIPGGSGTRSVLKQDNVISWVSASAQTAENVLSVCTGALVLAKAALLNGLKATTHHEVFSELQELAPDTEIIKDERFVDNGQIITSGGISAGIDMSLHVIELLYGKASANQTAEYMEYRRI
ncbi:MAG: AraC family transcriptional regulator [Desulfuromonas sp.]|nr:MAG: AraC family transcriptional regulator [Desulfuromonas sp.]